MPFWITTLMYNYLDISRVFILIMAYVANEKTNNTMRLCNNDILCQHIWFGHSV